MDYFHVDVFSSEPLSGNGLTVVFPGKELETSRMLRITQEFNQFETIFIYPLDDNNFRARIFTVEEELNFAGHPIIGASAVLYHLSGTKLQEKNINIKVNDRIIKTIAGDNGKTISALMDQGQPSFIKTLKAGDIKQILSSLNLNIQDIHEDYPIEVVSTGLPYLLLPLEDLDRLKKTKILVNNFEKQLNAIGAKFVYVFEPGELECRTWDNMGKVEDVATGSAAGPLCAYLVKNGFKLSNERIAINQGRFVRRRSKIYGWVDGETNDIRIEGAVSFFAKGTIGSL